tara:strand:- start:412 stop:561 length:150 start_codon:yes stop_codon:yes gene_type:complete
MRPDATGQSSKFKLRHYQKLEYALVAVAVVLPVAIGLWKAVRWIAAKVM